MINKDDFYLADIELCKQLEPIMQKKGIDADDMLYSEYKYTAGVGSWTDFDIRGFIQIPSSDTRERWALTYRKDSLEAALPGCFFARTIDEALDNLADYEHPLHAFIIDHWKQIYDVLIYSELKSIARLIILLDKEEVKC